MMASPRRSLPPAQYGVAGATLALIRTTFLDPRQCTVATTAWATTVAVGTALGPRLGVALLESTPRQRVGFTFRSQLRLLQKPEEQLNRTKETVTDERMC